MLQKYRDSICYRSTTGSLAVPFVAARWPPPETVTTSYNAAVPDLPDSLTSGLGTTYVASTSYDPKDRVTGRALGTGANTFTRAASYCRTKPGCQRPDR